MSTSCRFGLFEPFGRIWLLAAGIVIAAVAGGRPDGLDRRDRDLRRVLDCVRRPDHERSAAGRSEEAPMSAIAAPAPGRRATAPSRG